VDEARVDATSLALHLPAAGEVGALAATEAEDSGQSYVSDGAGVEDTLWADTLWIDEPIARLETSPGAAVTVVAWSREAAEVALQAGRVRAQVAPRLAGDHFVVRTPLATATAIGTDFSVTHDAARG